VDSMLANPVCKSSILRQSRGDYNAAIVSDASEFKVACKWLEGPHRGDISFSLSEGGKTDQLG